MQEKAKELWILAKMLTFCPSGVNKMICARRSETVTVTLTSQTDDSCCRTNTGAGDDLADAGSVLLPAIVKNFLPL